MHNTQLGGLGQGLAREHTLSPSVALTDSAKNGKKGRVAQGVFNSSIPSKSEIPIFER